MTQTPQTPTSPDPDDPSPLMRALAIVLIALPIAGILFHVGILIFARPWITVYFRNLGLPIVSVVAFLTLFGSYFHYRKTHMRSDILARVLANAWIFTIFALILAAMKGW